MSLRREEVARALGCAGLIVLGAGLLGVGLAAWVGASSGSGHLPQGVGAGLQSVAPPKAKRSLSEIFRGGNTPLPPPALDAAHCDDLRTGGPVQDGCVTAEIHCEEVVVGHTLGGVRAFDGAFYEHNQCWPNTRDWSGGDERIYRLVMPPGEWHAVITLDTPCADLDLTAMRWSGASCPDLGSIVHTCEMNRWDGPRREFVEVVSQGESSWLVAVEGVGAAEGAFALQVQCYRGLAGYQR
jgi:hypothetical protein